MRDDPAKKPTEIADTERGLLEAAIELYGQHGTQAVSLNQIRKHAQVANEAAIRYYFRNKHGLISKSLELVSRRLTPGLNQLAERLETLDSAPDVRTVIMHFGMPFASLYEADANSVGFLGSLIHGEGAAGQKLLADAFGDVILRYERLLAAALPEKSPERIHVHFFLAINLLIHGLSDMGILRFMPSISGQDPEHFTQPKVIVGAFADFVEAGICSGESEDNARLGELFPVLDGSRKAESGL